jgi:SWI/SNF-related matrix-associated actin-dependent regulator of chromatin subfamily A member 5
MIRFGAEEFFLSTESDITDEDIEAILEKGKQRTQERDQNIENELSKYKDSLSSFTFDGKYEDSRLYDYDGENYRELQNQSDANFDFIQMPKRDRGPSSYNIQDAFRSMYPGKIAKGPKAPKVRVFKPTICYDFQFYSNITKLHELELKQYESESAAELREGDSELPEEEKPTTEIVTLTEEEKKQLEKLKDSGFSKWGKRDFYNFVRGCERYGRDKYDSIALEGNDCSYFEVLVKFFSER